jgi:hypothetical protein
MKKLRDVPLRYGVAALVCGGMSLFLFGVVFAVLRQADRVAPTPAWAWVLAALIAVVAAAGAFFGLLAWGALSDQKSRLGSWFGRKSLDAPPYFLWSAAFESSMWIGIFLVVWAGSHDIFLGLAVFLCCVLLLLLIVRRGLNSDIEALDDLNDDRRATDRIPLRAVAASIAVIVVLLFVARAGIFIANYPLHKVALVPPPKLSATIDTTQDPGAWIARPFPSLNLGRCEILFQEGQGAIPGVNCLKSGGNNSDLLNKTK